MPYKKTPIQMYLVLWGLSDLSGAVHISSQISGERRQSSNRAAQVFQEMPLVLFLYTGELAEKNLIIQFHLTYFLTPLIPTEISATYSFLALL